MDGRWKHTSIVLGVALIASVATNIAQDQADRAEDRRRDAVEECRAELVAAIGDATANGNVAEWKIVGALAQGIADGVAIDRQDALDLADAGVDLEAANDRRQDFELDPTEEFCRG